MATQKHRGTISGLTFADTVYRARMLQRITQKELADALEVPKYKISRIERGITVPTEKGFLQKLAAALCISYDEIERKALFSRNKRGFEEQYPKTFAIIYNAIFMLSNSMPEFFLDRIERRLIEFGESEASVSSNLYHFLQGILKISELPSNGTRPLTHYFKEWNREMDEWSDTNRETEVWISEAESYFRQCEIKRRVRKVKSVNNE